MKSNFSPLVQIEVSSWPHFISNFLWSRQAGSAGVSALAWVTNEESRQTRPGHVTSLPSHPPGPPWPNQAADNFPFPGLFPSLSPSHCAQDSVSPMMIFPCISPSSPHPSLLSFKFELVETELKSPAPSFLSLNFSARSGVRNGDFSKAAPGAGKGNWKLL